MALQIAANLVPSGGGTFYLLEDIYLKGGLQVRDSIDERDKIALSNLKVGALVLTIADSKIWKVTELTFPSKQNPDAVEKVTWEELALGGGGGLGKRQVVIETCPDLKVDTKYEFSLKLGALAIALKIETSRPVRVRAFSTPTKDEENPYEFISTADHLIDDGRQLLADGTVFRTRNYSILANFEDPVRNSTYWTLESVDEQEGPAVITVTYLTQELSDIPDTDGEVITDPPAGGTGTGTGTNGSTTSK